MIETASGRAYLAFSPPEERDKVLQGLKYRHNAQGPLTSRDGELDTLLDQSRKLGVGFRKQGFRADTMSMSAPIYHGQSVIACLTVIWLRSALSFQDAVESYKQLLVDTATDLSRELAAGDYDLRRAERGPDILANK
ncbi:IclR family transcriptional regulator C-terminal domain-containing protein [Mesorhizobium sp. J428]|uniref:IclR family transcriptional regulator domain-containing protein n=1 Tax=Mesorhizobium sp. J428 TaxID=2898440 RepID=UPI0021514814|nr:IclR family transcriptional regulator C-terminal domain-containing protein [Mesorhizobium sp. J428]MCR5857969.1 hypothetical protein [Mesorhizobium sp. J428]